MGSEHAEIITAIRSEIEQQLRHVQRDPGDSDCQPGWRNDTHWERLLEPMSTTQVMELIITALNEHDCYVELFQDMCGTHFFTGKVIRLSGKVIGTINVTNAAHERDGWLRITLLAFP